MASLSISLLGPLQINLGEHPVSGFESVKSRALLAYLADDPGRSYARSTLAGLLWSERPEKIALNNLRHVLANLRQIIHDVETSSPYLIIDRETITLNPHSNCSVDTRDFRQLVNTTHNQKLTDVRHLFKLEQAVALYRGEFLEAFPQGNSPDFEEWILNRREMYRSQLLEVLNQLAKVYISQGEHGRAKDYARRQIEIEPWREEAHQQLMEALTLEGKRSEALAQYVSCCAVLKKELNVGPSSTTIQLYERIRDGSLSTAQESRASLASLTEYQNPITVTQATKTDNLPRSMTSFIGRDEEISTVKQLLNEYCLVTLTGPGGVGKSRLALEVARILAGEFRDGVWLIDVASLDHPTQVIAATHNALSVGDAHGQKTIEGLTDYLCKRQILLVFDNCENQIKACAGLAQALLQACPELKILATSRIKFDLQGEEIYHLPSLPFPDPLRLPSPDTILNYAAVRLFADRARAILPSFQITEGNLRQVVDICKRLDGIPLALELAASNLFLLTVDQLTSRLNGSFQLFLDPGDPMDMPGRQNILASIDWSCQMLSEKEYQLLKSLSIFEGGWTLDAAETVCICEGINSSEILILLTSLVNKSVVVFDGTHEVETRFRMLNTVQQYAREKFRQVGEEKKLHSTHCVYYHHLAEAARPRLKSGEHIAWIRKLDADRENLFQAIRWAVDEENDIPSGLQMLCMLERWWTSRGFFEWGVKYLRKGLSLWPFQSAERIPLRVEALCLLAKLETNRFVAISLVKQAYSLANALGPDNSHELGVFAYTAGFLSRVWDRNGYNALSYLDQSIQNYKRFMPTHSWDMGCLLDEKSLAYLLLGEYKEAGSLARESWEIFQETGDHRFSFPLTVLGLIAMQQRDYRQARAYIEEAVAQRAGVEDSWGLGFLGLIGYLERKQGHYGEAVTRLREAVCRSRQQLFYFNFISLLQDLAFTEIECSRGWNALEAEKHLLHATRLLGAAETGGSVDSLRILNFPKGNYDPMVVELRARLDSTKLRLAWKEGQAMWINQAATYALEYPLAG